MLNKLNRKIANGGELPTGFLIKSLGLFIVGGKRQLAFIKDVVSTYLSVRSFAAKFGGVHPLNKRQREFIAKGKSERGNSNVRAKEHK